MQDLRVLYTFENQVSESGVSAQSALLEIDMKTAKKIHQKTNWKDIKQLSEYHDNFIDAHNALIDILKLVYIPVSIDPRIYIIKRVIKKYLKNL